jgi:hypothetical protein
MLELALPLALALVAGPAAGAPPDRARAKPAAAAVPGAKGPADPLEARRAEIARQVLPLGARIQKEIEAGDVRALLARIPPEGLRCGGRVVPRARVEHDLRAEGAWLHAALFGGPGAPAPPGQPSSLKAFFAEAKEIAVVVGFREDPDTPVGLPCLEFRARDIVTPGAAFCFERRGGRWWLTESLYPC